MSDERPLDFAYDFPEMIRRFGGTVEATPQPTPVERLTAAIERLEALKASSARGPWTTEKRHLEWFVRSDAVGAMLSTGYVGNNDSKPHADLIVTLHRAIDPLLDMLRLVLSLPHVQYPELAGRTPLIRAALDLADAIVGSAP